MAYFNLLNGYGEMEEEADPYLKRGGESDTQFGGTTNTAPETKPTAEDESADQPRTFAEMQAAGQARPADPGLAPVAPAPDPSVPPSGDPTTEMLGQLLGGAAPKPTGVGMQAAPVVPEVFRMTPSAGGPVAPPPPAETVVPQTRTATKPQLADDAGTEPSAIPTMERPLADAVPSVPTDNGAGLGIATADPEVFTQSPDTSGTSQRLQEAVANGLLSEGAAKRLHDTMSWEDIQRLIDTDSWDAINTRFTNGASDGIAAVADAGTTDFAPGDTPSGATIDDTGGESTDPTVDELLQQLMGGIRGQGAGSEVRGAVTKSVLDRLNNPSPYNADVVRNEYDRLGSAIDADYDARLRGVDEGMARRGLFGSVGKDFHSGRLADTEFGRRSAKTTLADNLLRDFAKSYGDYQSGSVNQGLASSTEADASALDYIRQLMTYGQNAFSNDLDTARFNYAQDQDYADLLRQLLAEGAI